MVKSTARTSGKGGKATSGSGGPDKLTAWQIYEKALQERKSKDPNDRRQACEKGWLAAVTAVDEFLASKGRVVHKGAPDAHAKRNKYLADLAMNDENVRELRPLIADVAESLHGACFYAGEESPYYDVVLEKVVREILERTGHAP